MKYTVGSEFDTKIKIINNDVEVIKFDKSFRTGVAPKCINSLVDFEELVYPNNLTYQEFVSYLDGIKKNRELQKISNKEKSLCRAKNKVFDLVRCNHNQYNEYTKFVTLTFKDNITDFDLANKEFNNFVSRLNYYVFGSKKRKLVYLGIREPQERGAIHYHIVFFNLPYLPKNILDNLWRQGDRACSIEKARENNLDEVEDVAKYVTKYMTKNFWSENPKDKKKTFYFDFEVWGNKKAYFTSKNIKRPIVSRLTSIEFKENIEFAIKDHVDTIEKIDSKELFEGVFSVGCTKITYKNIPKTNLDYIKEILRYMTCRFVKSEVKLCKLSNQVKKNIKQWKYEHRYELEWFDFYLQQRKLVPQTFLC